MSALSSYDLSVADLLQWDAWPEEMKRIARAAVREEMTAAFEDDDVKEDLREQGREDQHDADQGQFGVVHEHLRAIRTRLATAHAALGAQSLDDLSAAGAAITSAYDLLKEAIERIDAIPDQLADVKELRT